jgi:hypothetical protein
MSFSVQNSNSFQQKIVVAIDVADATVAKRLTSTQNELRAKGMQFINPNSSPHISLGVFFSPNQQLTDVMMTKIREVVSKYFLPFKVGAYREGAHVEVIERDALNQNRTVDPLVYKVKTADPGTNKDPHVFARLNAEISKIVDAFGGVMERGWLIPHMSVGTSKSGAVPNDVCLSPECRVPDFWVNPSQLNVFTFPVHGQVSFMAAKGDSIGSATSGTVQNKISTSSTPGMPGFCGNPSSTVEFPSNFILRQPGSYMIAKTDLSIPDGTLQQQCQLKDIEKRIEEAERNASRYFEKGYEEDYAEQERELQWLVSQKEKLEKVLHGVQKPTLTTPPSTTSTTSATVPAARKNPHASNGTAQDLHEKFEQISAKITVVQASVTEQSNVLFDPNSSQQAMDKAAALIERLQQELGELHDERQVVEIALREHGVSKRQKT